MAKRVWRVLVGVLVLAAVACVGWALVPGRFGISMPNPNGYDDLVAAGWLVSGDMPAPKDADYSTVDADVLGVFVSRNAKALARARVGLARESQVRLPKTFMEGQHIENTSRLRSLARLFACEAAMHEREGDVPKAAAVSIDVIQLGASAGAGGLMIDSSMSFAIESLGLLGLSRLAPELSADNARKRAAELMRIDRGREPAAEVNARDLAYVAAVGPWQIRALIALTPGRVKTMQQPSEAALDAADRRAHAYRRLLAVKLALAAYRRDHPDAPVPGSLDALVPGDLDAVPTDPFAKDKKPLKLHVNTGGKTAHAYSIGPDGKDDGGAPTPPGAIWNPAFVGDLTLDLP